MSEHVHELTIPEWSPTPLNRLLSRVRARIKGKQTDRLVVVAHALAQDVPRAKCKRRVSVRVTAPGRLPDPDNLLKSLLDALVAARLLVDDSAAWIELGQVKVERGPRRQTVVTLEDLEAIAAGDGAGFCSGR
jgi:Holliday junction resolvase RusA-like endonuclease